MKIEGYQVPHSSFLSNEKDMGVITSMILKNENLKKLLYYTTKDCLIKPNLTPEQSIELFGKNIKLVPKLTVDQSVLNYIIVSFDGFQKNATNPEFRDSFIEFDIICHFDQWQLNDFKLRPFRIAAEIDTMFNNKHLSGIGTLEFHRTVHEVLNDEFAGLCMMYKAVHGEDDKKNAPNPYDNEQLVNNFNNIFN